MTAHFHVSAKYINLIAGFSVFCLDGKGGHAGRSIILRMKIIHFTVGDSDTDIATSKIFPL